MKTRDTSIEAYHSALARGWINECEHRLILCADKNYRGQGHTTRELMSLIATDIKDASWDKIQDYQKTVHTLKSRGVLEELEKRPCEVTGNKAHPVRLTYDYPAERARPTPNDDVHGDAALLDRVTTLTNDVHELRERLATIEATIPRQRELFSMKGH